MCPQKWNASALSARSAAATIPPPLTASSSFPARARNPRREVDPATASLSTHRLGRGGEHALELEERVERPLGERLAVGRQNDGVRAARNGELAPGLGVLLLVEDLELDLGVRRDEPERRLERAAERAAGRAEDGQAERRVLVEAVDQRKAAAERRTLALEGKCGLRRDRQPQ